MSTRRSLGLYASGGSVCKEAPFLPFPLRLVMRHGHLTEKRFVLDGMEWPKTEDGEKVGLVKHFLHELGLPAECADQRALPARASEIATPLRRCSS